MSQLYKWVLNKVSPVIKPESDTDDNKLLLLLLFHYYFNLIYTASFKTNILSSALTVENVAQNREEIFNRGRKAMNRCNIVQTA